MTRVARRIGETPPSATVSIADTAAALRQSGVPVIDLSAGRAAEPTPAYVCEATIAALRRGETHQTLAKGSREYREACAAKLRRESGIDPDPEREVIATMGVKQGLTLALLATVNPGDEVIIEDPCFVSYEPLVRLVGATPVRVPLRADEGFRWTRRDLESRLTPRTKAVLFNSPHNPTGTVHTADDLDLLAEVARSRDLSVITDEVYERVTWSGRQHISLATRPGMRERTITVMGLTKTFSMGGWRIGFAYAPQSVITAMVTLQQHLLTCPNAFVQAGAAVALREPPHADVLAMWADWEKRCTYVSKELRSIPGVVCPDPESGFYAWADVSRLGRADELADLLLREHRVAVVPGSAFGPTGAAYLRLTAVRFWDELHEAMQRIRTALVGMARPTRSRVAAPRG